MNLRIESDHDNLKEMHKLVYELDSNQVIAEDYKSTPGFQSEPILVALISTVSPIVIAAIRAWVDDRRNKREKEIAMAKIDTDREKIKMIYDLEKTRIILEEGENVIIDISAEEIEKLPKYLP